jgi:hypothetical protein
VATAFIGAMLEVINEWIEKSGRVSAKDCMKCFLLNKPLSPWQSERHTTFQTITSRAEILLDQFAAKLGPTLPPGGSRVHVWHKRIYKKICKGLAQQLARTLLNHGHSCLMIGFDKCSFLNQDLSDPAHADQASCPEMFVTALQRIIKLAITFPHKGSLTGMHSSTQVPWLQTAPSARWGGQLDPLPAWLFMGYDQMAPGPSDMPRAALYFSCLQRYGRPVRFYHIAV